MRNNLFPVGNINYFEGDISILGPRENNILFVSDCKVTSKKDLYQPYLQIHLLKTSKGQKRTIAPNGSFEMCITSAEYYNSLRDYNIEIFFEEMVIFLRRKENQFSKYFLRRKRRGSIKKYFF